MLQADNSGSSSSRSFAVSIEYQTNPSASTSACLTSRLKLFGNVYARFVLHQQHDIRMKLSETVIDI